MTYDAEDPRDNDNPKAYSSSLEFYKKALSHFMLNRMIVWNELLHVRNTTRCTEINSLINQVKKKGGNIIIKNHKAFQRKRRKYQSNDEEEKYDQNVNARL